MIRSDCDIYVEGRGFVSAIDVSYGDPVYILDDSRRQVVEKVTNITTQHHTGKVLRIDSGMHNVDVMADTLLFYHSEKHGSKMIKWSEIPSHTADKEYSASKYQPVLTWADFDSDMNCSVSELEMVARMCKVREYDRQMFSDIFARCSSADAIVLIDMLEFWLSESPGSGRFGRMNVKSRTHKIFDPWVRDELCRIVVLAGYTVNLTWYTPYTYGLQINYEAMPIPGSRPKNEKYFRAYHSGVMINIYAENKPILGRSKNRVFFLPCTTTSKYDII